MAKPGAAYPQVEPTAAALMDRRVIECPAGRRVAAAWDAARRARAEVLVLGDGRAVRRGELERLSRWGLAALRAGTVGWHGLPVVSTSTPEVSVRRLLMDGASMILVKAGRRIVGVIDRDAVKVARPPLSLTHRLERLESRAGEARLWLLRVAGKVGEGRGTPVFAVGGFVRDLLLERPALDVDLLVEGDGAGFARHLSEEVGGTLVVHPEFGTASIEGAAGPSGVQLGRIDIASARRERYDAPGALPIVDATTVPDDLRRRDFSVNAMALALLPSAFGHLLDPVGGQVDLTRRRLRPLSPLSFVEDPTRIFRAARYAARLGFALVGEGVRALELALHVGRYPALSGQRLRAELDLVAGEPDMGRALELLLKWRALKLWDHAYRVSSAGLERARAAACFRTWASRVGITVNPGEIALIALLVDQPTSVVGRCLTRLAIRGERSSRLQAAASATRLARRLEATRRHRASDVAAMLEPCSVPLMLGAWLRGRRRARRRVEWFLSRGRAIRPLLTGEDVLALGARRGPEVGECLTALRRRRLDRPLMTVTQERALVKEWLRRRQTESRPSRGAMARKEALT